MSDTTPQYFELLLYILELVDILNDEQAIKQVTRNFSNNPTATVSFQYIQTMSDLVEWMERDLGDLQNERNRMFRYLLDNENFRYAMTPIVRAYQ